MVVINTRLGFVYDHKDDLLQLSFNIALARRFKTGADAEKFCVEHGLPYGAVNILALDGQCNGRESAIPKEPQTPDSDAEHTN